MGSAVTSPKPVVIFLDRPRRVVIREISSTPEVLPEDSKSIPPPRKPASRLKRIHPMD